MMKLCVQVRRVVNRNTHFCCYHNAILKVEIACTKKMQNFEETGSGESGLFEFIRQLTRNLSDTCHIKHISIREK